MSNRAYVTANLIWARFASGDSVAVVSEVLNLLASYGIRPRQDDGELVQVNLSRPSSVDDVIVVGLRYRKRDGTLTEDHFLCDKSAAAELPPQSSKKHGRRRWLEFTLPEYRGTHKQQPVLVEAAKAAATRVEVNTITFLT